MILLPLQISEDRLGRVLKETQQHYELELSKVQSTPLTLVLLMPVWLSGEAEVAAVLLVPRQKGASAMQDRVSRGRWEAAEEKPRAPETPGESLPPAPAQRSGAQKRHAEAEG